MTLDDAYANAAYIPRAEEFPPRWQAAAASFREALGPRAETGVRYGESDRQVYDFFHPDGVAKGTLIFVHGGYWKAFDRSDWSHLAEGALARGWAVVMPGYDLCPEVRISDITQQIAAAVTAIAERVQGPLVLAGHSAGGHLVSRMLDPLVLPETVRGRIERVAPISPLADLGPLMQTSMNEILRLDTEEAGAESPVNMAVPRGAQIAVWVGADERPAFLDQAEILARTWGARHVIDEGRHHFDVIEPLRDRDSEVVRFICGV
ncbi:alpha/beta hydrolase [Sulfitobacter sp. D35]|uniref:alpha/beta hydrolase n=1 Tax=Sulfitobacter sp. D35 TaxID=3083252 RepID=UPI0029700A58|nr:alpha/beta hydrolase [Sulfitobacter sp. D35]MDW4498983.1 alpha/beta hydrolase [Sulfitobacter sp. D35]